MSYLKWAQQTITDFSDNTINNAYNNGFLFGRIGRGVMDQTRSIRIDLSKFDLSSENRRILKKTEGLSLKPESIPYSTYHWSIGKLGKNFYDTKFGKKTFSANKIKEALTDENNSNFNLLFRYLEKENIVGYAICRSTDELIHYCYPFYDLSSQIQNLGLGMMLRAIIWAKKNGKKYVYLGSAQRPSDTYKLQFSGLEWFDINNWSNDLTKLKGFLNK